MNLANAPQPSPVVPGPTAEPGPVRLGVTALSQRGLWRRGARRLALVSLVCGWAVLATAQEQQPDLLRLPEQTLPGLREIVADALTRAPAAVDAELKLLEADATRLSAAAAVLPRVSANLDGYLRYEERRDRAGSEVGFKYFYNVVLEQPLYHWGALANQKRIGEIRRALAQGEVREARNALVLEIRAQYAELTVRRLELAVLRDELEAARRGLRTAERSATAGELGTEQLEWQRLDVAQREIEQERAERQFAAATEDFLRLTGGEAATVEKLPSDVALGTLPPLPVPPSATGDGASAPAALQAAQQETEAARLAYAVERVRLRPKLNLAAGTSLEEVNYSVDVGERYGVTNHYVGLRLHWPIFDGYLSRAAVQQARVKLRRAERAYDEACALLVQRLRRQQEECDRGRRELAIVEARLNLSAAALTRAREQHRLGQLAAEELARVERAHERQRIGAVRARLAVLLQSAEYGLRHAAATGVAAPVIDFP